MTGTPRSIGDQMEPPSQGPGLSTDFPRTSRPDVLPLRKGSEIYFHQSSTASWPMQLLDKSFPHSSRISPMCGYSTACFTGYGRMERTDKVSPDTAGGSGYPKDGSTSRSQKGNRLSQWALNRVPEIPQHTTGWSAQRKPCRVVSP